MFAGWARAITGFFAGAGIKVILIVMGVILVALFSVSVYAWGLNKDLSVKVAEIKTLESKIQTIKNDCEVQKYELLAQVKQLEVSAIVASKRYTELNIKQNELVQATIASEKEKNRLILEKAKYEKSFKNVWRRLNTILN